MFWISLFFSVISVSLVCLSNEAEVKQLNKKKMKYKIKTIKDKKFRTVSYSTFWLTMTIERGKRVAMDKRTDIEKSLLSGMELIIGSVEFKIEK